MKEHTWETRSFNATPDAQYLGLQDDKEGRMCALMKDPLNGGYHQVRRRVGGAVRCALCVLDVVCWPHVACCARHTSLALLVCGARRCGLPRCRNRLSNIQF